MLIQGIVAGDVETGRLGHEPRRRSPPPHAMRPTPPQPPGGRERRRRNRRHGRCRSRTAGARPVPPSSPGTSPAPSRPGVAPAPGATSSTARRNAAPSPPHQDLRTSSPSVRRSTAQGFDQRGALVAQPWSVLTRVVVGRLAVRGEHVGSSGRGHGRHHRRCARRRQSINHHARSGHGERHIGLGLSTFQGWSLSRRTDSRSPTSGSVRGPPWSLSTARPRTAVSGSRSLPAWPTSSPSWPGTSLGLAGPPTA